MTHCKRFRITRFGVGPNVSPSRVQRGEELARRDNSSRIVLAGLKPPSSAGNRGTDLSEVDCCALVRIAEHITSNTPNKATSPTCQPPLVRLCRLNRKTGFAALPRISAFDSPISNSLQPPNGPSPQRFAWRTPIAEMRVKRLQPESQVGNEQLPIQVFCLGL